jgi:hypothetical protein
VACRDKLGFQYERFWGEPPCLSPAGRRRATASKAGANGVEQIGTTDTRTLTFKGAGRIRLLEKREQVLRGGNSSKSWQKPKK